MNPFKRKFKVKIYTARSKAIMHKESVNIFHAETRFLVLWTGPSGAVEPGKSNVFSMSQKVVK